MKDKKDKKQKDKNRSPSKIPVRLDSIQIPEKFIEN
jgi:hypothetical protein